MLIKDCLELDAWIGPCIGLDWKLGAWIGCVDSWIGPEDLRNEIGPINGPISWLDNLNCVL